MSLPQMSTPYYDIFSMSGELKVNSLIDISAQLNKHLEANQHKHLVLDLSAATYIDSSAIRLLVNLKKRLSSNGYNFYLLNPSDAVVKILASVNLDKVLDYVHGIEELEKIASNLQYQTYLPYTFEDKQQRRLSCMCPICGSLQVVGYLLNPNDFTWEWEPDDAFPTSYTKKGHNVFDVIGLTPIVCQECFMASINIADFHLMDNNDIKIHSSIDGNSKHFLSKSIKKRRKMMESGVTVGDYFFLHPRNQQSCFYSFLLAETCARSFAASQKGADPFEIGYLNYLALKYAPDSSKTELINNCRTWLSQVINVKERYDHSRLARAYFIMMVVSLNLEKIKEAAEIHSVFRDMVEHLPPTVLQSGISSPVFWFKQAQAFWQKEIESKSKSLRLRS